MVPRRSLLALALLGALALLCIDVRAAVHSGDAYRTDADWQFVDKFCFDSTDANALFTLIPTSNASTQFINFYSDQSWSDANDDSLTCAQKVALAKQSYSVTELAGLPKYIPVRGSVPRWWYVAFSNCAIDGSGSVTSGGISLSSWRLEFTNHAGTFQHQFSMDEQGILEMSIFFAALFFVLMIVLLLSVCLAKRKGQTSVVMQLVFLSILLEFIALAFNIGHYGKFSQDGRGVAALASLWYFFDFVSTLVLVFVIACVSGGWRRAAKVFTVVAVVVLLGLYIALYVWIHYIRHGWETTYDYETGLGWAIVGVRGLLTIYVLVASVFAYLRTRAKFYLGWIFFAVCWMVSLCVFVGIAHTFEAWQRRRIVFGLMASVQAAIYIVLICFFFGGDAIAPPTTTTEEKERERVTDKERGVHTNGEGVEMTGAAAIAAPAGVPEKRLDVDDEEHSHSGETGEEGALVKPKSTRAAAATPAAVVAPAAAAVTAEDAVPSTPLADAAGGSSSRSRRQYAAADDDHTNGGGQMDYSSVFALKQNVLERPQHAPNDDALDDNEVHFVLHQ